MYGAILFNQHILDNIDVDTAIFVNSTIEQIFTDEYDLVVRGDIFYFVGNSELFEPHMVHEIIFDTVKLTFIVKSIGVRYGG